MATTYIDLTNILLRDINEVPLSVSQFDGTTRGLHSAAKEVINRAYADILNYSTEWPFLLETEGTSLQVTTVTGQQEYTFSTDIDQVDWDSFFIISDDNIYSSPLQAINIDFYTQHMKSNDLDTPEGGLPAFVYRKKDDSGFGLSPIPNDRGFTVSFSAWADPTLLSASTDTMVIPERYYNVLISRARYYMWMFRENAQQASFALNEYERGIKKMHRDLVEKQSIKMRAV